MNWLAWPTGGPTRCEADDDGATGAEGDAAVVGDAAADDAEPAAVADGKVAPEGLGDDATPEQAAIPRVRLASIATAGRSLGVVIRYLVMCTVVCNDATKGEWSMSNRVRREVSFAPGEIV